MPYRHVLQWLVETAARALTAIDSPAAQLFDALVTDINNGDVQDDCRRAIREGKDRWVAQHEPGPERTKTWGALWAAECALADLINVRELDPGTIQELCGLWRDVLPADIAVCLVVEGAPLSDAIEIATLITDP
jgi:hypothetical protein